MIAGILCLGQASLGQPGLSQPSLGQPDLGQPDLGQPGPGQPGPGQPVTPEDPVEPAAESVQISTTEFDLLAIGIQINEQPAVDGVFVLGQEDGSRAVNLEDWRLTFQDIVTALNLTLTEQEDGSLELRSSWLVTRFDPDQLMEDPQLGDAITVGQLEQLLDLEIEFDIINYALDFKIPALADLEPSAIRPTQTETPLILEGLPIISAPGAALTAIEQDVDQQSQGSSALAPVSGQLRALGTIADGILVIEFDQPNLDSFENWSLQRLQHVQVTPQQDRIFGSQTPFWRNATTDDYWAWTWIQRNGFTVPSLYSSDPDPRDRLEASQLTRTLSGQADPGTLVQLLSQETEAVLGEVLVDESGLYQFNDIPVEGLGDNTYEVALFPDGRLTVEPERQDVRLASVAGQIPVGSSARIWSMGFDRIRGDTLLGDIQDLRGGVAQRWGLSESFTLGLAAFRDDQLFTEMTAFLRPRTLPLKLAVALLSDPEDFVNAELEYDPNPQFQLRFLQDPLSSNLTIDWQITNTFTLRNRYNSRQGLSVNGELSFRGGRLSIGVNPQTGLQTSLGARFAQRFQLRFRGNSISSSTELNYSLTPRRSVTSDQSLQFNYETRGANDQLAQLTWEYRQRNRSRSEGQWRAEFGYGLGSEGSGLVASLEVPTIAGLQLQGRYRGISLTSNTPQYSLELTTGFTFQPQLRSNIGALDLLQAQGGMTVQPYFDLNGNGRREPGEAIFTEDPNLLLINNQPLSTYAFQTDPEFWTVELTPGLYRLEFDPVGFPLDWQVDVRALAVEVKNGAYTSVRVPLIQAFTVSGVVTTTEGDPVNGARVEAITQAGTVVTSITNAAGVYFLEELQLGEYQLQVNGRPADPATLQLEAEEERFQTLNLQTEAP